MFALYNPDITDRLYSNGNTPKFFAGIEVGYGKVDFGLSAYKSLGLCLKCGKISLRLLLRTNRKSYIYVLSIGAKIDDLG